MALSEQERMEQIKKQTMKKNKVYSRSKDQIMDIISNIDNPDFDDAVDEIEELVTDYSGLLDMKVNFNVDLGSTAITLDEFVKLGKGSIIDLEKAAGESAEVYVNGRIIGKGEVMVYEKNLAIRVNEILSSDAVLYYFSRERH
jgi:flagellar motor switch protein FliN/FliY